MHKMYLTGIRKSIKIQKNKIQVVKLYDQHTETLDHQKDNRKIVMFVSLQSPPRTKLDSFKYLILSN